MILRLSTNKIGSLAAERSDPSLVLNQTFEVGAVTPLLRDGDSSNKGRLNAPVRPDISARRMFWTKRAVDKTGIQPTPLRPAGVSIPEGRRFY